jgi:Cu(I)/Ag(I) efflux system membrane fusion protein
MPPRLLILTMLLSSCAAAPRDAELAIPVGGICALCRYRIEDEAMQVPGVRSAEWGDVSRILSLKVDPALAAHPLPLHQALAEAGHDTPLIKAPDEIYGTLPGCCYYRILP